MEVKNKKSRKEEEHGGAKKNSKTEEREKKCITDWWRLRERDGPCLKWLLNELGLFCGLVDLLSTYILYINCYLSFVFFFCIIFFTTSFVSPCITQLWVSFVFLSTGRNETICGTINGLFDLQTGSSICRTNWHACWQSLPLLLERPCAMSVQRCCFINRKLQTVITIQEGKTTPILVQLKTFFLFATQVGGGGAYL